MSDLTITYLQTELAWENPSDNRRHLEQLILAAKPSDIIVLPEMFLTGFTMSPQTCAQPLAGDSLNWLIELASKTNTAIAGSLAVDLNGQYRNRFVFVTPQGRIARYDKRHLFTMGDEPNHYEAGEERVIINYRGWRILPLVCYDLRFPVWSRNIDDYDLMMCVANWPAARRDAWRTLLKARAIENQSYVVGVNRVGDDGHGVAHSGDSQVIDYQGALLCDTEPFVATTQRCTLSLDRLQAFKKGFPASADRDTFKLESVKTNVFSL